MHLTGPETAKPGSTVTLAVELGGSGRHDGGVIDVGYDPALLEPVGFAAVVAGQASVALVPGALPSQLPLSFRVKAEGQGMASIAVTGVTLQVGGQRMASPASSSTTINVLP